MHLIDLSRGLAKRGHEVHAVVRRTSPLAEAFLKILAPKNTSFLPLKGAIDVFSAVRLRRMLREWRIDILHAHLGRDYPLAALAILRTPHPAVVFTRHVLFPLGTTARLSFSKASRVIAVSTPVAQALKHIVPQSRLRVVHNGIDLALVSAATPSFSRARYRRELGIEAPLLVGIVGDLSTVKGQEIFVQAACQLLETHPGEVEFVMAGDDTSRSQNTSRRISELLDNRNLRRKIHLLGRRQDIPHLLASLDVFVSCSRFESFGLAIAEAMAAGLAVVATATAGAMEQIEDGVNGLLVPVDDIAAIVRALESLLWNPLRRRELGEAARATACARFGLEQMVDQTERVYREALL